MLLATTDPAVRDQWIIRHPLLLPGRGAAKYELVGVDVADRRDPRSPFTGGRGWDNEFRDGKTGQQLYQEDRRVFLQQRYPHLTPDRWPGGPGETDGAELGHAEARMKEDNGGHKGEVAGGKGALEVADASEEDDKGASVLDESEEGSEQGAGPSGPSSMIGTAQDVAFWDDEYD